MDLGCGTGLVGLLLLQRQPDLSVTGIDIQSTAIRLAEKAAAENGLADRLTFHTADLRTVKSLFPTGSFDLAVCNPPYYPPASGAMADDSARRTARSEVDVPTSSLPALPAATARLAAVPRSRATRCTTATAAALRLADEPTGSLRA